MAYAHYSNCINSHALVVIYRITHVGDSGDITNAVMLREESSGDCKLPNKLPAVHKKPVWYDTCTSKRFKV